MLGLSILPLLLADGEQQPGGAHPFTTHGQNLSFGSTAGLAASVSAQIGISIESEVEAASKTPPVGVAPSTVESFVEFSTKMVEHLFNYVSSFSVEIPGGDSGGYVPLSSLQRWYDTFRRRLQQNPNFWRS